MSKKPRVILMNTSSPSFKGGPSGVWLEELATPYYAFLAAGFDVTVASVLGGPIPIDAGSMGEGFFTDAAKRFLHDPAAVGAMCHSVAVDAGACAGADALYLTGGHGTCVDFVGNATLKACVEAMYAAGKVVAADCHGPIGLVECVKPDGTPLVAGLCVTAFSDAEEAAVGQTDNVPFLLEAKFKALGGLYQPGADWHANVAVAGKLVTGQNPQSSDACAAAVVKLLAP